MIIPQAKHHTIQYLFPVKGIYEKFQRIQSPFSIMNNDQMYTPWDTNGNLNRQKFTADKAMCL
jgi:hypothetical protein